MRDYAYHYNTADVLLLLLLLLSSANTAFVTSFAAQALQETSVYNFSFCIPDEMYILIKYPKYEIF